MHSALQPWLLATWLMLWQPISGAREAHRLRTSPILGNRRVQKASLRKCRLSWGLLSGQRLVRQWRQHGDRVPNSPETETTGYSSGLERQFSADIEFSREKKEQSLLEKSKFRFRDLYKPCEEIVPSPKARIGSSKEFWAKEKQNHICVLLKGRWPQ